MFFSLFVGVLLVGFGAGEVFTSMSDMESLMGAEKEVTTAIDNYIAAERDRLQKLRRFASEYEKKNQEAVRQGTQFVENPVNAFLLIKRLTSDWGFVDTLMRNNLAEDFLKNITEERQTAAIKFPTEEDLDGAAVALMRLQDVYTLSTADMANGIIQGVKRAEPLTAQDCFDVGRVAYNKQDYYHTVSWSLEALERLNRESPPTMEEWEILEYLAFGLFQQGNTKRALSLTRKLLKLNPDHPRAKGNIKYYKEELEKDGLKTKEVSDSELPPLVNERPYDPGLPEREAYERLCRGDGHVNLKKQSKLYCYYKRDRPFLRYGPVKVEIVHLDPLAVLFRNVMSDREADVIKGLALPKLRRATVTNKVTGDLETASYRVSKTAWLKGEEHPVVERINRRVDLMTNLNMATAEELQMSNYGLGGHYDPHFDFATKEEVNAFKSLGTGNRVATVLFYLETTEAGGGTVFPPLEAGVFPTKNDCLFWYNLFRSGEGDERTRHAACPVLAGQKWVANKWIHERGQEFRRPCGLTPEARESYVGEL